MTIDYVARDYDAYFTALKTKATQIFPTWTEFKESNIGTVMLMLFSSMGDQSSFYLNRVINETFLPTVKTRRNAIKILKRLYYEMGGRVPASVDVKFTFEGGGTHTEDVTIPEGYVLQTVDGLYQFETTEDLIIASGVDEGVVSAKNQVSRVDTLTFDGSANQEVYLQHANYIQHELVLEIESQIWTRQDDLLSSGAADKHFKIEIDDKLRAISIFGDGVYGAKPNGSGVVDYKTGGGDAANQIQADTITKLSATILDALNNPVSMEVTNDASPSGGSDEESIDEARVKAPKATRASQRTVSRDDYEANSEGVESVARALAIGKNEDGGILTNTTQVYVVPEGGGVPSTALKDAVLNELENVKPIVITTVAVILNGVYKNVTIAGSVVRNLAFSAAAVKTAVDEALTKFFDYENLDENNNHTIDFGINKDKLYLSSIINVIMQTTINTIRCVEDVTLTSPTVDVPLTMKEIPALQSLAGLTVS